MGNPMPDMSRLKEAHDAQASEVDRLHKQMAKIAENIEEYSRQKMENDMVLSELKLIADDAVIFKKIGPCLIKQDMFEAKSNVEKRIEYISGELARIEKQKDQVTEKRKQAMIAMGKIERDVQAVMQSMQAAQSQVAQ